MNKRKSKRGGAREGAGRKPFSNRMEIRIPITVHVKKNDVNVCGGKKKSQHIALCAIENTAQNLSNIGK